MSSKSMSLKAKINNYAKQNKIAPQVVMQNYMFEHLLERIAVSEYRDKFVIKGGFLISSLVGLDTRSTMDLDTTLQHCKLSEAEVARIVSYICATDLGDEIAFSYKSIEPERENDRYGGFCVKLEARFEGIVTPLSIDITTGDIITPAPVEHNFSSLFHEDKKINLLAYNIETILAEKIETILGRNVLTTRMRDFYDVHILCTTKRIKPRKLTDAIKATAIHRGSWENIQDTESILQRISSNSELIRLWKQYQRKFPYAKGIEFEAIIATLREVVVIV